MTEIQLLTTHSTLILLQYQPVFVNSLTMEACKIHTRIIKSSLMKKDSYIELI